MKLLQGFLAAAALAIALAWFGCVSAQSGASGSPLLLHNVVTGRPVPGVNLAVPLERVELPPAFTVAADAPAGAASAVFMVDGRQVRIDNQAPFFLTEDDAQKPVAWKPGAGASNVAVTFHAEPDGRGALLAQAVQRIVLSPEGMQILAAPATEAEQDAWLAANLDTVLQKKTFAASNGLALPYRIFVPPAYSPKVKYPVLIYLHGRGQRGTDNGPAVYNSLLFRGRRSIVSPMMQQDYPAIVLVPQCSNKTANEEWARWIGNTPQTPFAGLGRDGSYQMAEAPSDSGKAVLELIDATLQEYSVDRSRVYLTGISMGGFGTWEYVARRPELFAAAIPMAGYSDPSQLARFSKIPFWIFHGNADQSNPVQGSRNMFARLKEAGADVRYTEYPDTNHNDTFRKAWAEPGLLPWIFSQRRG